MLLNKRHSYFARFANYLALIAFILSGSIFTHAKEYAQNHHKPAAFHENGGADEGHHHHSDAPCKQCSHSHLIHCGANVLALVADFDVCIAQSCSAGQFRYVSFVRSTDTSLDPPPPRAQSLSV